MTRKNARATAAGMLSILIWGTSPLLIRLLELRLGTMATVSLAFLGPGLIGLAGCLTTAKGFDRRLFADRLFYVRWATFLAAEALVTAAILLVGKPSLPMVILLNFLWPTSVVLCGILFRTVAVRRGGAVLAGGCAIVAGLAAELLAPSGLAVGPPGLVDAACFAMAASGSASWGVFTALSTRAGDGAGGTAAVSLFQASIGVLAIPALLASDGAAWQAMGGWTAAAAVGYCLVQFVAYAGWDMGARKGDVVLLGVTANALPWIAIGASRVVLDAEIGLRTVATAAAVGIGAAMTRYGTTQGG
jgi:drug/metabolite transporter (DMT)-like permease